MNVQRTMNGIIANLILVVFMLTTLATVAAQLTASDRSLRDAVQLGDVQKVRDLLASGANVDAGFENRMTAIFLAEDPQIVDLILARKPKLKIRDAARIQTVLEQAAERWANSQDDKEEASKWKLIIEKLRAAGAEYTIDTAIYLNDVEHVRRELANNDHWVDDPRGAQNPPLWVAAGAGRDRICKLLLEHKADPNGFEQLNGYSMMVAAADHPKVVELLVQHGANLRRRITWRGGRSGIWTIGDEATALHYAVGAGNAESTRVLLKAGLDVNAADDRGQTPLHVALQMESFDRAWERDTKRFVDVVKLLVEHDASLRFEDRTGKRPLDLAKELKNPKAIRTILQKAQAEEDRRYAAAFEKVDRASEHEDRDTDPALQPWLKPHDWRRDRETPALSLGEKGRFDDQHITAPHVIQMDGEYWMYYSGSQRCVDAGTYKGVAKDPAQPQKSDQRLFKLGLARSKDGVLFERHSQEPVFSFGDDIHSVVTAAILKNPDGSVCRENGKLRMYFAAVDFPHGTYKHDLYETTSSDGLSWAKPTLVMENAYAPCVIKDGDKYRMWYTWINRHPWHINHAESSDGTHWTITEKPCIVMDQKWEVKDQVYPMVLKADGVWIMLYGCYWSDDKHTALGFAVSRDGLTWTKHPDNPVFRPEPKHDWESNFTTSHTLLCQPDGSFRLWYAGRRQPPWSNLYFAIGTAKWSGPGK